MPLFHTAKAAEAFVPKSASDWLDYAEFRMAEIQEQMPRLIAKARTLSADAAAGHFGDFNSFQGTNPSKPRFEGPLAEAETLVKNIIRLFGDPDLYQTKGNSPHVLSLIWEAVRLGSESKDGTLD